MAGQGGLDDDDDVNDMITLRSKDNKLVKVSKRAAMMSSLVKNTLLDKSADEVSLFHIEGDIVQKVVAYMEHHINETPCTIERPLTSLEMSDIVSQFDASFVDKLDQTQMFKLLLAANYMDIKPLLDLLCAKIATLIKSKSPEQIRATFNIRSDYTEEEEEEVRRDHKALIE
jgi:S-phase kinase-associated protein 1